MNVAVVDIKPVNTGGPLRATASIVVENALMITEIDVLDPDGASGPEVRMPSRKVGRGYKEVVYPISPQARRAIHDAVIKAYEGLPGRKQ